MAPAARLVPLAESQAVRPPGAVRISKEHDDGDRIEVTVVLRPRTARDERRKAIRDLVARLPGKRNHLSPEELTRLHGATSEDIDKVVAFARARGLRDEDIRPCPERRCVILRGTVAQFDSAFGVTSDSFRVGDITFRSYEHPVHVPRSLSGIVMGVLGLDNQQVIRKEPLRFLFGGLGGVRPPAAEAVARGGRGGPGAARSARSEEPFPFTEHEKVMEAYEFPLEADGQGQSIGIICLGGGFRQEDMQPYLSEGQSIEVVELDEAKNDPVDPEVVRKVWEAERLFMETGQAPDLDLTEEEQEHCRWTAEVTADIQHILRFAPGGRVVVYLAPNTPQGKYTAFTTALVDHFSCTVISCSSGTHEDALTRNYTNIMDDVFSFAALRGVTLCCSSGDDGDGTMPDGSGENRTPSAHFPASSPHVLACGGTMPATSGVTPAEVVWNEAFGASGGGVSRKFHAPWWQTPDLVERKAGGRGRGVPDVAGKADIGHGYRVTVCGVDVSIGGTSSAAPMWAGLIARINQGLGRPIGFVNPLLYQDRALFEEATRPITRGSSYGKYHASPGWDACTGWGTPLGRGLLSALKGS